MYSFPNNLNISDLIDNNMVGVEGIVEFAFKHTRGHVVFAVKILEGKFKDKHILIGRTGIKKLGKLNKQAQIIDTKVGKEARKSKHKRKDKA